ncbi:MAG: hypothetical protein RLZZ471_188 [Actinomycetota bacterium]|jgi:hypothetical protein
MASWVWWIIWAILGLFSLGYLAYRIYELLAKSGRALQEVEKTAKLFEPLVAALDQKPTPAEFEGNLLDDPAPLVADYVRGLKRREAKRAERQRRLINKLIDFNESEFKP